MSDDKLDVIQTTVNKISTDIAVLVNEMQTMNNRGCEASVKADMEINKRLEANEKEHTMIKGIAYAGGIIGSAVGWGLSFFNHK